MFSLSEKSTPQAESCNDDMFYFCIFFLGTSASQAIAADDLAEQCSRVVPESGCQPAPKSMEQQPCNIEKGGVTSSGGKGKMSD